MITIHSGMGYKIMVILFLCLSLSLFQSDREEIKLEELKWKNRIIIFFADQSKYKVDNLDDLEEEFKERKIVYFIFGENFQTNSSFTFSPEYQKWLKSNFQASSSKSNWILIGLDGGVKLKKEGDLDWDYIFKTIDSMPMRQSEIRNGK